MEEEEEEAAALWLPSGAPDRVVSSRRRRRASCRGGAPKQLRERKTPWRRDQDGVFATVRFASRDYSQMCRAPHRDTFDRETAGLGPGDCFSGGRASSFLVMIERSSSSRVAVATGAVELVRSEQKDVGR